ncbi:MAG: hypothetical protein HUU49_01065 [Candidatus Buchananbacteria bacterium]|nr:hypothetical protein [Candidatus Buchananbacteria bacterium]
MDYLEAKINQLVVEYSGKQKNFVRTFSTKPSKQLLNSYGKILGLIEIKNTDEKIPELIDLIIEEIKNNYYRPTSNRFREPGTFSISDLFEDALKKTNLTVASFLETKQITVDLNKINIVIALIHNQELHFTAVGDISAILLYNLTSGNYRIINILEASQYPITTAEPFKFFSQVVTGRIRPRDVLLLASSNVLDYFSLDRVKNLLTATVPQDGLKELKDLLERLNGHESFGCVTIDLDRVTVPAKKTVSIEQFNYREAASQDSIKELVRTEQETEKLLTPSLFPEIKKYAGSFKTAFSNYLEKAKSSTNTFYQKNKVVLKPGSLSTPKINIPRPNFGFKFKHQPNKTALAKKVVEPVAKVAAPALQVTKSLYRIVIHQSIWQKISNPFRLLGGQLLKKFKTLPASSKILLVIAVLFAILFSQSVIWLSIKNNREQKIEVFNQLIFDAESKKNEAQASLIYRDEAQARDLLLNAKTMLTNGTPITKTQQEKSTQLVAQIEEELQKLRHFIEIKDPIQIVNFQNLDSQANIAPVANISKNIIYTQNTNNKALYKANLDTRVMSAIVSPTADAGNFVMTTALSENELIFFNDSLTAFQLNPNNDSLSSLTININNGSNIVDVTSFNSRIYLLDEATNQIYRYTKTGNSFGGVQNWLRQEVDLSGAASLTIDGAIYVIKKTGEILKFENGQAVEFKIKTIDPPLQSPTKIRTSEATKYLYVLDPATKRLVVLDKEGNLINQYYSEQFNDLKDFVVLEKTKQIYVLNGTSIIGFGADHLN